MKVNGTHYRTVWMEGWDAMFIDQLRLPFAFEIYRSVSYEQTCSVIRTMLVRGAGAIGAAAGFAMAQATYELHGKGIEAVAEARATIEVTRPTARNLFYATERVFDRYSATDSPQEALLEAHAIADEDSAACQQIGHYGQSLIADGARVQTHCNAGWLAFVDHGSALSPIYAARDAGKRVFVYADETRPRNQGAKLTAWELAQEGIEHAIVPDNAGAHIMSMGMVDIMIVGADRIARNGDTANKIGTLEKAICAKEYGIPFYIAAPTSTFDLGCASGREIIIEQRSDDEVLYGDGMLDDKTLGRCRISNPSSRAVNYGFDVTPARLIAGIITERGIIQPTEEDVRRIIHRS